MAAGACKVLMVYPRFSADSFWNFAPTCQLFGAKYPAPPLGLITVAALLPPSWTVRLIDRNAEELTDDDIDWADLVMTGGMITQHNDTVAVIDMCQARAKPVAVGGPSVTSVPEGYADADFRILGEAEGIIDLFIAAWEAGARDGTFAAEKFTVDVTRSPIPRFDLLNFDNYLHIGVQFSRGCPFTCEFCDIIELYGRVPRTKATSQMLAELETLYRLGYRGHVDFVDDNLIGNKKALKAFLPHLSRWLREHDYPFSFTTEASINLADDPELLRQMNEANFFGVFVGIESPDPETLVLTKKKQNTRRSIAESIHKLYASGLYVTAGFIVGFDSEKGAVADAMVELIEEAAIPICMVGLLFALPNTQLTRRLEREGRLHPLPTMVPAGGADQCTQGLNYDTLRPRADILRDYKRILERIYDPVAYAGRLRRLAAMLDNSNRKQLLRSRDTKHRSRNADVMQRIMAGLPEPRDLFWQTLSDCASINSSSLRHIVVFMAFYLHLGPFSRHVMRQVDRRIVEIEAAGTAEELPIPALTA
jgi:radical SAM superfamily enzyme YgiQ (UPF0313 family)